MTEEDLRDLFREMREEPLPADSLARVRTGVAGKLARRRWWVAGLALAPVCAAILLFLVLRPSHVEQPAVAAHRPAAPVAVSQVQPAIMRSAPRRIRKRKLVARATLRRTLPPSIRLETEDPDVVILLVGN